MFNSFILVYLKEALKILSCILLGSKSNRKAKRGRREACNRHTVWIWTMQSKVSNFIPYQCCILLRCTCKSYTFELFDCWILVYASFCLLFILCPQYAALLACSFFNYPSVCPSVPKNRHVLATLNFR